MGNFSCLGTKTSSTWLARDQVALTWSLENYVISSADHISCLLYTVLFCFFIALGQFLSLSLGLVGVRLVLGLELEVGVRRSQEHLTFRNVSICSDFQMQETYEILIQSLWLPLAMRVSNSLRPRKAGGLSLMRGGRCSNNPIGT